MTNQMTPQEVIQKMGQLINQQRRQGYKIGWLAYRIEEWQAKNRARLYWVPRDLHFVIREAAQGEVTSEELLEDWQDAYDMVAEMEAAYGGIS